MATQQSRYVVQIDGWRNELKTRYASDIYKGINFKKFLRLPFQQAL